MSITDELREWMDRTTIRFDDRGCLLGTAEELTAIADRIDSEHEAQLNDAFETRNSDENLESDGWVRLPLDADGERIHLGDRLEHINGEFTVNDMTVSIDNLWRAWDGENGHTVLLVTCRHHHAPTVEDVLREFAEKIIDSQIPSVHPTYDEAIAEYAAKLRLAESEDA